MASRQPSVKELQVKAQTLEAGEDSMLASTTSLSKRYDDVMSTCSVRPCLSVVM